MVECKRGLTRCLASQFFAWWALKLVEKWIGEADSIICVSRRHAQIIEDLAPDLKDKITVIYNLLPPQTLNNHNKMLNNMPTFIYAGGDEYTKGFDVLLKTIKLLERSKTRTAFLLTGKYKEESVKQLHIAFSDRKHVEISVLGRILHENYLNVDSKAWSLVFPSRSR